MMFHDFYHGKSMVNQPAHATSILYSKGRIPSLLNNTAPEAVTLSPVLVRRDVESGGCQGQSQLPKLKLFCFGWLVANELSHPNVTKIYQVFFTQSRSVETLKSIKIHFFCSYTAHQHHNPVQILDISHSLTNSF